MTKRGRKMPPLTAADFVRMLRHDGWHEVAGGRHRMFEHPTKPGKVSISDKWTGVKTSHETWKGVLAQARWTKVRAEELYWSSR